MFVPVTTALTLVNAIAMPLIVGLPSAIAQSETPSPNDPSPKDEPKRYAPEVVAKAEEVFKAAGLRRSGKTIQATETSSLSRALTTIVRDKREVRMKYQEWKRGADQIAAIRLQLKQITAQDVDLNLRLAQVAPGDTETQNRIIGLINASRAKAQLLIAQRTELKKTVGDLRGQLNDIEAAYAEKTLAIRSDYDKLRDKLDKVLQDKTTGIAVHVMHVNFQTPKSITADSILAAVDKRIAKIESEVFSETIPLHVRGGAMYVDVVVGKKATRMVVDSGASMITMPAKTATELGIDVPLDASPMKLVLADGSSIDGRHVVLPRVRIGEFEAENVAAAVLDAGNKAEPLLGMSFLGNFKFEIDKAKRSLKLLRVETK